MRIFSPFFNVIIFINYLFTYEDITKELSLCLHYNTSGDCTECPEGFFLYNGTCHKRFKICFIAKGYHNCPIIRYSIRINNVTNWFNVSKTEQKGVIEICYEDHYIDASIALRVKRNTDMDLGVVMAFNISFYNGTHCVTANIGLPSQFERSDETFEIFGENRKYIVQYNSSYTQYTFTNYRNFGTKAVDYSISVDNDKIKKWNFYQFITYTTNLNKFILSEIKIVVTKVDPGFKFLDVPDDTIYPGFIYDPSMNFTFVGSTYGIFSLNFTPVSDIFAQPVSYYPGEIKILSCSGKCSECYVSSGQIKQELCKRCNNAEGYYEAQYQRMYMCYSKEQLKNYYLIASYNMLYKCYENCAECKSGGHFRNQNCISCSSEYPYFYNGNCYKYKFYICAYVLSYKSSSRHVSIFGDVDYVSKDEKEENVAEFCYSSPYINYFRVEVSKASGNRFGLAVITKISLYDQTVCSYTNKVYLRQKECSYTDETQLNYFGMIGKMCTFDSEENEYLAGFEYNSIFIAKNLKKSTFVGEDGKLSLNFEEVYERNNSIDLRCSSRVKIQIIKADIGFKKDGEEVSDLIKYMLNPEHFQTISFEPKNNGIFNLTFKVIGENYYQYHNELKVDDYDGRLGSGKNIQNKIMVYVCPRMCLECYNGEGCLSCRVEEGYYQLEGEENENLKYKCLTIKEMKETVGNYYLNKQTKTFKKCHSLCHSCIMAESPINHNCESCIEGYSLFKGYCYQHKIKICVSAFNKNKNDNDNCNFSLEDKNLRYLPITDENNEEVCFQSSYMNYEFNAMLSREKNNLFLNVKTMLYDGTICYDLNIYSDDTYDITMDNNKVLNFDGKNCTYSEIMDIGVSNIWNINRFPIAYNVNNINVYENNHSKVLTWKVSDLYTRNEKIPLHCSSYIKAMIHSPHGFKINNTNLGDGILEFFHIHKQKNETTISFAPVTQGIFYLYFDIFPENYKDILGGKINVIVCFERCEKCNNANGNKDDNKCISCKNSEGYYGIWNEEEGQCFTENEMKTEKPNYFLSSDNLFHKCHELCSKCSIGESLLYHNCDECIEGYIKLGGNMCTLPTEELLNCEEADYEENRRFCKKCNENKNLILSLNSVCVPSLSSSKDSIISSLLDPSLFDIHKALQNYSEIFTKNFNLKICEYSSCLRNPKMSYIDLGKNEVKLKNEYGIDNFILIQVDKNVEGKVVKEIEYVAYSLEKNIMLDMSILKNEEIKIFIPVEKDKIYNEENKILLEKGYDYFEEDGKYYYDKCIPVKLNDIDVPYNLRKEEFFNTMNICNENCIYNGLDDNKEYFVYVCNSKEIEGKGKSNINIGWINKYININLLTCFKVYNEFYDNLNKKSFIIVFIIISIQIIFSIIIVSCGINYYILEIIKKIKSALIRQKKNIKRIQKNINEPISNPPKKKGKIDKAEICNEKVDKKNYQFEFNPIDLTHSSKDINSASQAISSSKSLEKINVNAQNINPEYIQIIKEDSKIDTKYNKIKIISKYSKKKSIKKNKVLCELFILTLEKNFDLINIFFSKVKKSQIFLSIYFYIFSLILMMIINCIFIGEKFLTIIYRNNGKYPIIYMVQISSISAFLAQIVYTYTIKKGILGHIFYYKKLDINFYEKDLSFLNCIYKRIKKKIIILLISTGILTFIFAHYFLIFNFIYSNSIKYAYIMFIISILIYILKGLIYSVTFITLRLISNIKISHYM